MPHNSQPNSTGTKNIFFQRDKSGQNSSEYGEIMIQTLFEEYFIGPSFTKHFLEPCLEERLFTQ